MCSLLVQQFSDLREGFAPCATLRLFFPKILGSEYRQILYVDTDVIFLADPARIWRHFNLMSPTQTVAMARENLNDKCVMNDILMFLHM